MNRGSALFAASLLTLSQACTDSQKSDGSSSKQSYDFSAAASTIIVGKNLEAAAALTNLKEADTFYESMECNSQPNYICFAPSKLTGKYFGAGLLIQAQGNGMLAYLHADNWAAISGASETFDFDASAPLSSSGALKCCGGEGDLAADNVYFSDTAYVFAYLDATFQLPYSTADKQNVSPLMKGDHTIRFVMVDDIIAGYKRGDLLYKDTDSVFKWVDSTGSLSATRPTSPLTMHKKIVDLEPRFADGKEAVPVFYTGVNAAADGGLNVTSEAELKETDITYTFSFDTSGFMVLMRGADQMLTVQSIKDIFTYIHLAGLPNDHFSYGASGKTGLTIQGRTVTTDPEGAKGQGG